MQGIDIQQNNPPPTKCKSEVGYGFGNGTALTAIHRLQLSQRTTRNPKIWQEIWNITKKTLPLQRFWNNLE